MKFDRFKQLGVAAHDGARMCRNAFWAVLLPIVTSPAFAGGGGGGGGGVGAAMSKAKGIMDEVSTGLIALGLVVVTIAIMFVGFRMIFRSAQWADLAPVFWGGLLVGGAATFAGALMA